MLPWACRSWTFPVTGSHGWDEYLATHPVEFLDYAANDAVIALRYIYQLFGDHKDVPLTLSDRCGPRCPRDHCRGDR